jgi:hypothetical protein
MLAGREFKLEFDVLFSNTLSLSTSFELDDAQGFVMGLLARTQLCKQNSWRQIEHIHVSM